LESLDSAVNGAEDCLDLPRLAAQERQFLFALSHSADRPTRPANGTDKRFARPVRQSQNTESSAAACQGS
jgi:hypothetical protein